MSLDTLRQLHDRIAALEAKIAAMNVRHAASPERWPYFAASVEALRHEQRALYREAAALAAPDGEAAASVWIET